MSKELPSIPQNGDDKPNKEQNSDRDEKESPFQQPDSTNPSSDTLGLSIFKSIYDIAPFLWLAQTYAKNLYPEEHKSDRHLQEYAKKYKCYFNLCRYLDLLLRLILAVLALYIIARGLQIPGT